MLIDRAVDERATLLLAHGAGAPMDSAFMNAVASALSTRGISVLRFEFPYMEARRRAGKRAPPNGMPVLEACFREQVAAVSQRPLFIGGKSMGGRVATHIADSAGVDGVIALGYPFHPPKRPDKLRVEHLTVLQTRCLIVQGTRDALGSREDVARYALSPRIQLHWLADGDHSFEPRKSSGRSTEQNLAEAVDAMVAFMITAGSRPRRTRLRRVPP